VTGNRTQPNPETKQTLKEAGLYIVQGGGHTWPGGGPLPEWFVGSDSRSIDATITMWAFFRAHRLPTR
jgi:poly(3-hydroxybutyrate) depolymerase